MKSAARLTELIHQDIGAPRAIAEVCFGLAAGGSFADGGDARDLAVCGDPGPDCANPAALAKTGVVAGASIRGQARHPLTSSGR